ncbi:hypothetical protein D915_009423 [Fasciola hepatica]|uniref:Uncharacterized protein n=1 Tax=Fasciola hepatica TaxID=6192 RepID=A0A4E0QZX9_FASHE|nr:hypothetical protein D915_009423 [Fasciola hepatica]
MTGEVPTSEEEPVKQELMVVPSEAQAASRPRKEQLTNCPLKTRMPLYELPRDTVQFSSNYSSSRFSCDILSTPTIPITGQTVN